MNNSKIVERYYKEVCNAYVIGNVESSFYTPIISLFTELGCAARDMSGERSGQTGENIDIKLWHTEEEVTETEPFAAVEVKKVNGIDQRAKSQIFVELNRYGNVILTDNLEWQFWCDGNQNMYADIKIIELVDGKLKLINNNVELFFSLLKDYIIKNPVQVRSSSRLAEYMARHACTIRSIVSGILGDDGNRQPLINDQQQQQPMFPELLGLYSKIRMTLQPSINVREFADMYAQTIVYGLFIARYNDKTPDTFNKFEAIGNLQNESALLKQFFMHIAGTGGHPTLQGVIDKLCALYRISDISALLGRDTEKDTIVHFYEEFLSFYDPALRKELGVFYTPVQAVRYLVKTVDELLVKEFEITGGLSNNEQTKKKVPCTPYRTPNGKSSTERFVDVPRVAILDPACGTGSFGAEIIKYVKQTYFSGSKAVFYDRYIRGGDSLLSRLIGFEIMMTSYVVAHLKIRRTIDATLGHKADVQLPTKIYLTNTLSPPSSTLEREDQPTLFDFSAAITDEAYHADTWKTRRPIKVVIGNPPYLAASKDPYDISAYKTETDGVTDFKERKHWLNDYYVKFFRFAEQIIEKNGSGILAYVSNNGYLDNHTFRGMRASLLRTFDKIFIVNLHGRVSKKDVPPEGKKNENIFDITQGIALFIGVKKTKNTSWAKVYYTDVWGTRAEKLESLNIGNFQFAELKIDSKMAYFIPWGTEGKEAYEKGVSLFELFPTNVTGIVTGNDKIAVASSNRELNRRLDIVRNSVDGNEILNLWGKFGRGQTSGKIKKDSLSGGVVTPISFRPFDDRWTYYSGNSCGWVLWPREKKTMGHLMAMPTSPIGANIGIVFCKPSGLYSPPFVTRHIADNRLFSASCNRAYIAPLYLREFSEMHGEESWEANLNDELFDKLTQYLPEKPSPIEVFDYAYGVLHDPVYYEKYKEFLCRDFPRIPIINDPSSKKNSDGFFVSEEMFHEYASIGSQLRKTHLMEEKHPIDLTLDPNTSDDLTISDIRYKNSTLYLNETKKILGIPEKVWKYQIGGYQVLDKWFKEHKGDNLTIESFTHIENTVGAIMETLALIERLLCLHK